MQPSAFILATNNFHKIKEFADVFNTKILCPKDLGISDFEPLENGATFDENAMIKAQCLYEKIQNLHCLHTNYIIFADDSGLCVEAIDNMPGIFSARYAHICHNKMTQENASDSENRKALINTLMSRNLWGSYAFFQCSIAYVACLQDSVVSEDSLLQYDIQYRRTSIGDYVINGVVHGRCEGIVAIKEQGNHGFGYDSMFYRDREMNNISDAIDFTLQHTVASSTKYADSYDNTRKSMLPQYKQDSNFLDTCIPQFDSISHHNQHIYHNSKITLHSLVHSLATLPLKEKMKISHRGKAIAKLQALLAKLNIRFL